MLLRNIGGIPEAFNQPDDTFEENQDILFLGAESFHGIGGWEDYYSITCAEEEKTEIDFMKLVTFAKEANGPLTLYESVSEKVSLFSHDRSYDNVECMEDQTVYTAHTFNSADTFRIMLGAWQWITICRELQHFPLH